MIDERNYLSRVERVIARAEDTEHLPAMAPVVAMYLSAYLPVVPPAPGGDNMTSREIADELEQTCRYRSTILRR